MRPVKYTCKVFNVYFIAATPFSNSNGHHQSHSDAEDAWTRYGRYGHEYEFLAVTTISVVFCFVNIVRELGMGGNVCPTADGTRKTTH